MYEMATCGMRFEALAYKRLPKCLNRVMIEHKEIYGEDRAGCHYPSARRADSPKTILDVKLYKKFEKFTKNS